MAEGELGGAPRAFLVAGVATIWGVLALVTDALIVNRLTNAARGGGLAPPDGWSRLVPWPTTFIGALLFLAIAYLFLRWCTRSGLPSAVVVSGVLISLVAFWLWAVAVGLQMAGGISVPSFWPAVRYVAPLSMSSTAGAVLGLVLGRFKLRRAAVTNAEPSGV